MVIFQLVMFRILCIQIPIISHFISMGEWLRHHKTCPTCRAPVEARHLVKVDLENDDAEEENKLQEPIADELASQYGTKPAALLRLIRKTLGGPALMGQSGWNKKKPATIHGTDPEARFVVFSQHHQALELMARTLKNENIAVVFATGGLAEQLEAMEKFKVY